MFSLARFKVVTLVSLQINVFWDVTLLLANVFQCFQGNTVLYNIRKHQFIGNIASQKTCSYNIKGKVFFIRGSS